MQKTILVVEDVTSMRGLVSITLNTAGYNVIEACNGEDALKKMKEQKVHMIISDVNMPSMNGLEFLKALKSNPEYKIIPVVMLTTHGDEATKKKGQMAGAKAWIVKPFKPESILNVVKKIMG